MDYPWHLYLMGSIYIIAGLWHFVKPKIYLRIMPRYLPQPKLLVYFSGLLEIVFGMGLFFSQSKDYAVWGLISLLILFFLVHLYMMKNKKTGLGLPLWILITRLLFQFVLIWWAWYYLRF